jgi:hypothetical protein
LYLVGETRNPYTILENKPFEKRRTGRQKRGNYNITILLIGRGCEDMDWTQLAQDRSNGGATVQSVTRDPTDRLIIIIIIIIIIMVVVVNVAVSNLKTSPYYVP